jgi:hypothetical protein
MEEMEIVKVQDVQLGHVVLDSVFVEHQLNIVVLDKRVKLVK